MNIFYTLFGYIMKFCYSISFSNYIIALFFFALIMQILFFPLGIKQQKSSVLLAKIRPKENAIRSKYRGRNDRATQQKMQLEIQEMYKQEGYSATSGCLPLLIQLPLIMVLFGVIQGPLTYTTDMNNANKGDKVVVIESADTDTEAKRAYILNDFYKEAYKIIDNQVAAYENKINGIIAADKIAGKNFADYKALETFIGSESNANKEGYAEGKKIAESDEYKKARERIKYLIGAGTEKDGGLKYSLRNQSNAYREMNLMGFMQGGIDRFYEDFTVDGKFVLEEKSTADSLINKEPVKSDAFAGGFIGALVAKEDAITTYSGEKRYDFNDMLAAKGFVSEKSGSGFINNADALPDFTFIGNTTTLDTPSLANPSWLWLIPILVFLSSFWSAEITRKLTVQPVGPDGQPMAGGGMMKWGMPLISTWFTFNFPAAIGIYWIFRSMLSVVEKFILQKMYPPQEFTEEELKKATTEVKQAKKRKKLITIEVDEDDTSYDDIAISEERAEKIRRRREKQLRDAGITEETVEDKNKIDIPQLKEDSDRKDKE